MRNALLNTRELLRVLADELLLRLAPGPVADQHRAVGQYLEPSPVALGEAQRDAHSVARGVGDRRAWRGRRGVEQSSAACHAAQAATGCHPACPCSVDLDPEDGAA